MAARIMWGAASDQARAIDADALERAETSESAFTLIEPGEVGEAPAGPVTEQEGGPVSPERMLYLVEDDGASRPIAVAAERVTGNADVLAAVEEEWRARTGREDIRPDAAAEPPPEQPPVEESRA